MKLTTNTFEDSIVSVPFTNGQPDAFQLRRLVASAPDTVWVERNGSGVATTFALIREALDILERGPIFEFPTKKYAVIQRTEGVDNATFVHTGTRWVSVGTGVSYGEHALNQDNQWKVIFEGIND